MYYSLNLVNNHRYRLPQLKNKIFIKLNKILSSVLLTHIFLLDKTLTGCYLCRNSDIINVSIIGCSNNFFGEQEVPLLKHYSDLLTLKAKGSDLRVLALVAMATGLSGTWSNRNWFRSPYFMYSTIIHRGSSRVHTPSTRTMFGSFSWDIILISLLKSALKNNLKKNVYHREIIKFQFPFSLW